jgi:hypothetical protein
MRRLMKNRLTEDEASGMTLNERLSACDLFDDFDKAVAHRDVAELERILDSVYLPPESIQAVIKQVLGSSKGPA